MSGSKPSIVSFSVLYSVFNKPIKLHMCVDKLLVPGIHMYLKYGFKALLMIHIVLVLA